MPLTTSTIFERLERHETPVLHKINVQSEVFRWYRGAIFSMHKVFQQVADQQDDAHAQSQSVTLREHLSRLLTAPSPWDERIPVSSPDDLEARWGKDVSDAYANAKKALSILRRSDNPLRIAVREQLDLLTETGTSFRIYCHPQNRPLFESLLPCGDLTMISAESFLHNVGDYAASDSFDTLIKVGPLRAKGWGQAPDALLTSPRFDELCQISWEGTHDEDDFGFDPVQAGVLTPETTGHPSTGSLLSSIKHGNRYRNTDVPTEYEDADLPTSHLPEDAPDELKHFHEIVTAQRDTLRSAVFLYTDGTEGLFYPRGSAELSYDPSAGDPSSAVKIRRIKDELKEGMFVLAHNNLTADVGTTAAAGVLSREWKEELRRRVQENRDELEKRLRKAGLTLIGLSDRIKVWMQTGNVIFAPQLQHHFKVLIDELMGKSEPAATGLLWWQKAWNEVRRSRGEAITFGTEKSALVQEELCEILRNQIPADAAEIEASFPYTLPAGHGPQGTVTFLYITRIETNYVVPEDKLTKLLPVESVEQWRV